MTELRAKYRTTKPRLPHLGSAPERTLETQLTAAGVTGWEREVTFHPVRRWLADFLFRDAMLIVEVEGGTYTHGRMGRNGRAMKSRHLTPTGFRDDCIKYAEATLLGYRVFRFDTQQVDDGTALRYIEAALEVTL